MTSCRYTRCMAHWFVSRQKTIRYFTLRVYNLFLFSLRNKEKVLLLAIRNFPISSSQGFNAAEIWAIVISTCKKDHCLSVDGSLIAWLCIIVANSHTVLLQFIKCYEKSVDKGKWSVLIMGNCLIEKRDGLKRTLLKSGKQSGMMGMEK